MYIIFNKPIYILYLKVLLRLFLVSKTYKSPYHSYNYNIKQIRCLNNLMTFTEV